MRRVRSDAGFTLIELLIVVTIISIVGAIAVPGLMRSRQSGNEASAIASVHHINTAQAMFAASCGGGGYAGSLAALATPPPAGAPFISPDLVNANVPPGKSGYLVDTVPTGMVVLPQANTCNGVAPSVTDYLATAIPVTVGTTGQRSFASDARNTIFQDTTGAVPAAPLQVAGTVSMLQ